MAPWKTSRAEEAKKADEMLRWGVEEVLADLDMREWERAGEEAGIDVKESMERALKGEAADIEKLFEHALQALGRQMVGRRGLMVRLMVPALLCGLLERFREAFGASGSAEVCGWACFLWVAVTAVGECALQAREAAAAVERLAEGMQALFPLLLTLLAAVGAAASAVFFQPAVVAASGTMTALVRHVSFSLALAYAVLAALDNLSDALPMKGIKSLLRSAAGWSLGICFTVFAGVMAIQGFGAAARDGVTLRTAQYAMDHMIPVVGGMLADTADTLVGCALMVKNALGVTGLLVLAGYLTAPLLRLAASVLLMRIAAAVTEPVSDGRAVKCMREVAEAMTLLGITQLCVAAMFFLLIVQLLVVGNMTVSLQ